MDLEGVEPGLFHLGYPPLMRQMYIDRGKNLQAVFRKVKQEGWITSLDMALPDPNSPAGRADWEVILANVLPFVDFFLPSLDELLYMIDREMFHAVQSGLQISTTLLDDLSQRLLGLGATVVAIKLGDQGLYLRTGAVAGSTLGDVWGHRQLLSPIFEVDVQGTTGAGDTTIAGFLAGLHQSNKPEDVVTLANGVGAFCVEAVSAIDGIPSLKEVQARISRGWKRVQPTMDHHQWQARQHGVLFGPNDRRK
ncbi:MAG: carbohydrate kinase family protein [Firmicutes bacterium]|nr:carbohydrate kinase family protein [Bacillota bacterium]